MTTVAALRIDTPIGPLTLGSDGRGLSLVWFDPVPRELLDGAGPPDAFVNEGATQLAEFFKGRRRTFDLTLSPGGTPFQRDVWRALQQIPFGETRSYGQLARLVGRPGAARAVGAANGRNPLAIIVPCHRVIGADGSLTGYAGGMDNKRALLAWEQGQLGLPLDPRPSVR